MTETATATPVSFTVVRDPKRLNMVQLQLSFTVPLLSTGSKPCCLRSLDEAFAKESSLTPFMARLAFDLFRYHSTDILDLGVRMNIFTLRHNGNLSVEIIKRYVKNTALQIGSVYQD